MLIGQELEDRGITALAAIGAALGILAAEVTSLLTRHQWREGDVALLEAAAALLRLPRKHPSAVHLPLAPAPSELAI